MAVRRFTRASVIDAATEIADRDGLEGLTLRAIAASLGTGQASIYRHVAGRSELLGLLADEAARGLPTADETLAPFERLERAWNLLYAHLMDHRWIAEAILQGDVQASEPSPFAEQQLAALRDLGFADDAVERAFRSLFLLTLGFVLNRHEIGHGTGRDAGHRSGSRGGHADFAWALRCLLVGMRDAA